MVRWSADTFQSCQSHEQTNRKSSGNGERPPQLAWLAHQIFSTVQCEGVQTHLTRRQQTGSPEYSIQTQRTNLTSPFSVSTVALCSKAGGLYGFHHIMGQLSLTAAETANQHSPLWPLAACPLQLGRELSSHSKGDLVQEDASWEEMGLLQNMTFSFHFFYTRLGF